MPRKSVATLALAVAACFPLAAYPADGPIEEPPATEKPRALGSGLSTAALIAAALAGVAFAAAGGGGGGGGGDGGQAAGATSESSPPSRTLSYSSAADFRTSEYRAQPGLAMVRADRLYYNGHYRWYEGHAADPAAGTGIGVKIAVADTGINAREAATGSAIAIDAGASYDYIAERAGAGADEYGHGTHVAGLIAAPKNGAGMHGLAYNATLVNFKIGGANGIITASDAQLADMMQRAAAAGAMVINNSWATPVSITAPGAADVQASVARWIEAARAFVAQGGVVVFAAGNEADADPSVQPGLPHRVAGLAPGWLAVVAVDESGRIAAYSNRCGVAAAWCLAAPGGSAQRGLYSMQNNGDYASLYGTSMAAPQAAAALGALKSMFPNLSYPQLRERLLFTANRAGAYADTATYGQGLMDLEAASSPVGGISVPTGSSANGATAAVASSGIEFQAGTLRALGMQPYVLVVDNYQRAPFWVPAQSFFRETAPRIVERQWATLKSKPRDEAARGLGSSRLGFSSGAGVPLDAQLELAWLPRLAASGVDSLALGYASDLGGLRVGLVGTLPSAQTRSERSLESSSLGSRSALGFVAQQRFAATTYGVSLAAAENFERPLGIAASGAFGVGGSAALSSGAFVEHALARDTVLEAAFELAQHRTETNAALSAPSHAVHAASFGVRTRLAAKTLLSASFRREWSGGGAAELHVPLTIAENGDIGRVTYALPYDELVGRSALTLRLDHALTKRVDLRAALTHEVSGFGNSVTGFAAVLEILH